MQISAVAKPPLSAEAKATVDFNGTSHSLFKDRLRIWLNPSNCIDITRDELRQLADSCDQIHSISNNLGLDGTEHVYDLWSLKPYYVGKKSQLDQDRAQLQELTKA